MQDRYASVGKILTPAIFLLSLDVLFDAGAGICEGDVDPTNLWIVPCMS